MEIPSLTAAPAASFLSRMDARAKIALLVAYSVAVFLVSTPMGLLALGLLLAAALVAGRLSPRRVFGTGIALYVLVGFVVVLNGLRGPGGWCAGAMAGARLLLALWMSYAVCFSSTSTQLQEALSCLLRPLAALRVPVDDIAITLALALRLMPEVSAAFLRVASAQRSRAAHLDDGGLARRAHAWGAVFAPTLVALFRRASQMGVALEARCYGLAGSVGARARRTQLSRARWRASDTAVTVAVLAVLVLSVAFL